MSLARRLQRIVRTHLGTLRGDPLQHQHRDDPEPDVPPDVAAAYRALEVPVGSDCATVKAAYRRLMKRYHQDRFENDERRDVAGEVSKRLNVACDRVLEYLDGEPA